MIEDINKEFIIPENWLKVEELKEGVRVNLMAGHCQDCGTVFFPAYQRCIKCGSEQCKPLVLSGKGTLYSETVVHQAPNNFSTPFRVGYVLFPEGPLVFGQFVDMREIQIGDQVEVVLGKLREAESGEAGWAYMYQPTAISSTRGEN
ncbi:Zn-ribbon domain-containing OB-fold protein [Paradesulfitobacterium ferrireducens]|uniref:Zn-ribbon domain-containing OB-fold protein n=1 Tax=Paradesulfitobacterium ferrireducens TaxID=2816476 RepID=UPI001A90670E|nr:OB-fold domain-containing protein [Paradesulfitobacterium ferrireducens]